MQTFGKIVLILIVLSLVIPMAKSACDLSMHVSVPTHHAPMCHMGNIAPSTDYLGQLQQFNHVLIERIQRVVILFFTVMGVGMLVALVRRPSLGVPVIQHIQRGFVHMKYWDPERLAYVLGRIQRTHYQ